MTNLLGELKGRVAVAVGEILPEEFWVVESGDESPDMSYARWTEGIHLNLKDAEKNFFRLSHGIWKRWARHAR